MPLPFLQKIHKDHRIPMKKLEAYWEKAKDIAKESAKRQGYPTDKNGNNYGLITRIFKNMLGLSHASFLESTSRRRHKHKPQAPHSSSEDWETKEADSPGKEGGSKGKSAVVHKNDTKRIKDLESKGYKLVGPVQGSPHLLYEQRPQSKPVDEEDLDDYDTRDYDQDTDDKDDEPTWWSKLNREEQERYLEEHPHSRFQVTAPRDDDLDPVEHPDWWKRLTRDEQRDYLKRNPDSNYKLTAERASGDTTEDDPKHEMKMVTLRKVTKKLWIKRRDRVASVLQHHRTGLRALKTLLSGGEVSQEDLHQAKKTAVLAAKLVLGSLVVVGLMAGLAPFAAVLARTYMGDSSGMSFSSEASDKESMDLALEISDSFYDWLMSQDIPALLEKLKSEQAND